MDTTAIIRILAGILFLVLCLLYFYPTFKAMGKRNTGAIFALNLLTGWSAIGWVVALIWALKNDTVALRTDELQQFIRRDRQIKVVIYILVSMVAVILAVVMMMRHAFPVSQPKTQESTVAGESGQQQPEPTAGNQPGGAGSYPGITVATELTSSPLDSEAKIEATKVFEGLVTKCGDKYFIWNDQGARHGWPIEFMEKPVLSIGSLPVSEEAKLNGLTWQGRVDFSSSADKILWPHQEGHWSLGQSHTFSLLKINGAWVYESYMGDKSPSDSFSDNIPCEKVSERLSQEGVSRTDSQ